MTPIVPPVPRSPKAATATNTARTTRASQAWRASPRGRRWPEARGFPLAGAEAAKRRAERRLRLVATVWAGPPGRFLGRKLRRLGRSLPKAQRFCSLIGKAQDRVGKRPVGHDLDANGARARRRREGPGGQGETHRAAPFFWRAL